MGEFSGKVALVTGAGLGIGRGIAMELAARGADVAVVDTNRPAVDSVVAAIQAAGGRARAVIADVTSYESVERAIVVATTGLDGIDFLVNNAGVGHRDARFVELERAEWERVLRVCLYGTLHVTRAVLPSMIERRRGRIVNIASDAGLVGGSRCSIYSAAKAAVIGHTRALAQEVGEAGITVNVICPGDVETERWREHMAAEVLRIGQEAVDERLRAERGRWPAGRRGQPADVAGAVAYFCSEGASWITGQRLSVNGGASMA